MESSFFDPADRMRVSLTYDQLQSYIIIKDAFAMRISESEYRVWFTEYDGSGTLPAERIKCAGMATSEVFDDFPFSSFFVRYSHSGGYWIAKLQA